MPHSDEYLKAVLEGLPERQATVYIRDHLDTTWTNAQEIIRRLFG